MAIIFKYYERSQEIKLIKVTDSQKYNFVNYL